MPLRQAHLDDAAELAALCTELGYPSTAAHVGTRLPALLSSADHLVLVATDAADSRPVGWIHAMIRRELVSDPFAEIAGLVVSEPHRNAAIGLQLLRAAEEWALDSGIHSIRVRSNVVRERAHRFYLRAGYELAKTSHLFVKNLGARTPERT